NRARYYDPTTQRWLSQDPLGFDAGDSNLYRYVNNAPTGATDPSGLQPGGGGQGAGGGQPGPNIPYGGGMPHSRGAGTDVSVSGISRGKLPALPMDRASVEARAKAQAKMESFFRRSAVERSFPIAKAGNLEDSIETKY